MISPTGTSSLPTETLTALQAASQALALSRDNEEGILARLQREVKQLLPPGRIHMLLFSPGSTTLYAWDKVGKALPPSYFDTPAAKSIVGWLRETKESLLVDDFERDWEKLPAKPSYESPNPPRSALFVPLVVADEALGAVSVQSHEQSAFTSDHLWQLKILANQAAAAISAVRLLHSERWRSNQLETLAEVTRSVVSILNIDELLSHVVDIIEASFDYYHVQIFVMEEGTERAVFRASSGLATHDLWRKIGHSAERGEGIVGWVLQNGETLVAPDVSIDPLYIPDDPRLLPDTRSEIAVPLRLEDEVLGVLDVQSDQYDAFNREDVFILTALADAIGLAIVGARLYSRVQEDAWVTVALLEVAEATSRLTELQEVVDTIVRITPLLTGVIRCAIWLRELGSTQFKPMAEWGIDDELVRMWRKNTLDISENEVLKVISQSPQPLVLRGDEADLSLEPVIAQALLADSIVILPLQAKGEVIGIMAVSIEESNAPLSEVRIPLLKGIADQAASAIENAHLIAAQQEEAWVSTALLQVAEAMSRTHELPETLDVVTRLTAVMSGLDRCVILLRDGSDEKYRVSRSYSMRKDLPAPDVGYLVGESDLPLLRMLEEEKKPLVIRDPFSSELIPEIWANSLEIGAIAAVPLVANQQVLGALLVDDRQIGQFDSPRLLDILNGIANQAAVAIERAQLQEDERARQRIALELGVANTIQRGFLPEELPQIPGYEVAALWEPAREIGGDFYDFIPLQGDQTGIVIADVADKGIPAALYMALSRTTMRLVSTRDPSPSLVLQRVNTAIVDTTYSDLFVTVYYAILDPYIHRVTYASGGHGLALQASEDGTRFLRGKGMVLGVMPSINVEEFSTEVAAGDYLIFYTDGVTDAVNAKMEDFGEARLVDTVRKHRGLAADEMLATIHQQVRAWQGEEPPFDDFTLVVLRRLPAT